jgi:type IV secretory pathway VirJ component
MSRFIDYLRHHWKFRQFLVLGLLSGATILAFKYEQFRARYTDICLTAIGGYLAQLKPQNDD